MRKLFFSADGRIGPEEFIKGAVILLAINFALWLSWFVSMGLGVFATLISVVTIFCWACLFAKRFHDANMNGMMFLPVLGLFLLLLVFVVPILLFPIIPLSERELELTAQLQVISEEFWSDPMAAMSRSDEENMVMISLSEELNTAGAIRSAIQYFLAGAITAFGINKLLKTDPNPNRWG